MPPLEFRSNQQGVLSVLVSSAEEALSGGSVRVSATLVDDVQGLVLVGAITFDGARTEGLPTASPPFQPNKNPPSVELPAFRSDVTGNADSCVISQPCRAH